jgi:TonB family protein
MTFLLLPWQLLCLLAFPQQQPTGAGVYHVGGGVTPPVPIYRVEPQFSEFGRDAGVEGTVLVQTVVGTEGQVQNPRVVRGIGFGLDEAAVAAVQQWKFKPGTKEGQPVPIYAQIEVSFRLLNGGSGANDAAWLAAASTSEKRGDQARAGKAFYWGHGVTQDYEQALVFFQKAAAQDDARSESYLGLMYSQSQGVARDTVEAARWFRKAAEQNDVIGQVYLGKAYLDGTGVSVDFVQAYLWLSLAIQRKGQEAQATSLRNQVAAKMSPAEIAEAEALAQKWQPRKN